MVDVRYLKLYHTHYGKDGVVGDLLLTAQNESFLNEGTGTEITVELMHLLWSTTDNTVYPLVGKNTTEGDLIEAMFAIDRSTTTVMDIERVRACDSPEDYQDGDWTERGVNDDLCAEENLAWLGQSLKRRIKLSEDATNERTEEDKRVERPNEREMDDFYFRWDNFSVT